MDYEELKNAVDKSPGSYKLWYQYLSFLRASCKRKRIDDDFYNFVNDEHARSLLFMHKMPVIWIEYLNFLRLQGLVTKTRRTFDNALRSLPITQHFMIWNSFIEFLKEINIPDIALIVMRRRLMIDRSFIEDYVDYLLSIECFDEAVRQMISMLDDPTFVSKHGKSTHDLWIELCLLVANKSRVLQPDIDVESILRSGISKFTDDVSRLWCSLASHFTVSGRVEKARDIYEEAIKSVCTVHDFTVIFDAYVAYLEVCVAAAIEDSEDTDEATSNLWIARLEKLMRERPFMLSAVKLRQNPNNIPEWVTRADLFSSQGEYENATRTFDEAILSVDASRCVGYMRTLWIAYATFAERYGDVLQSRQIFETATSAEVANNKIKHSEDVVSIWCAWVEMELRNNQLMTALEVARRAVAGSPRSSSRSSSTVQTAARSPKLWGLLCDLEECFGTPETLKSAYDHALQIGVATPQLILNWAALMEEKNHFEEQFQILEKGISCFHWPHKGALWLVYLSKFMLRYKGQKMERIRELFEESIIEAPREWAFRLLVLYGRLEEQYGMAKLASKQYERACNAVGKREKDSLQAYKFLIAKVGHMFGPARTREVFTLALQNVPDSDVKPICMQFAALETSLKEFERARSIYQHCAPACFPTSHQDFWSAWKNFEMAHGDEESYKEMLRAKRAVEARYAQVRFNTAEIGNPALTAAASKAAESLEDQMAEAEALIEAEEREIDIFRGGEARGDYEGPTEVNDGTRDLDAF